MEGQQLNTENELPVVGFVSSIWHTWAQKLAPGRKRAMPAAPFAQRRRTSSRNADGKASTVILMCGRIYAKSNSEKPPRFLGTVREWSSAPRYADCKFRLLGIPPPAVCDEAEL